MKLFVVCRQDNLKIYLPLNFRSRRFLPYQVEVNCPYACRRHWYYPRSAVFAESSNLALGGLVAGGALGLVVGPEGLILGGLLGALFGASAQNADRAAAEAFNAEVV
jgi:hypothetical protein